jgi:excisionase family DNA binding protein
MSETCSTIEAARRLGVSVQTVQRWVDLGQLRAWKTLGGHRRLDLKSVEALVQSQRGALELPSDGVEDIAATSPTILIVDDDEADRELLARLSQRAVPGARVETVGSGFEALISLGAHTPDVLITDVIMPGMDGIEMLRSIARSGVARPGCIVAVSSHAQAELAALGELPAGITFLPKPVDHAALTQVLRQATDTPRPG